MSEDEAEAKHQQNDLALMWRLLMRYQLPVNGYSNSRAQDSVRWSVL